MRQQGTARLGKRTKDLVKRLGSADIAIIDHADLDRVTAETLLLTGVEVVVNAAPSITGAYPNIGPLLLLRGGVRIIDAVGPEVFDRVRDGQVVTVDGGDVIVDGALVASGTALTIDDVELAMDDARAGVGERIDEFARNTLEFLEKEKALLAEGADVPKTRVPMAGRHVLVVVRGYDYKEDLRALVSYVREMKPVLVGVDGGADALMEVGFTPDLVIGDMDSVTDDALRSGAQLIVHGYPDGRAPGMERLWRMGLDGTVWAAGGTSEDVALLLAYESGADLIVAVGTHANLHEMLDKGRRGMASTFLVRLKVGQKLVDAKGVNKLYRSSPGPRDLVLLVLAALAVIVAIVFISSDARAFIGLLLLRLRAWVGI
ncbi:MAG: hypothetical protein FDZ70_07930 [Actinobacteria bacterium]|nr:MAG: hypothetical protein FDZ70_07930 [Actinomycetota bacterium]